MASAWATLVAYSFMAGISYFIGKKYYSVPYQIKNIFIYLILSIGLSYLSFLFFRGNLLISIIFVCIFIAFALWNEKNEIKQILK